MKILVCGLPGSGKTHMAMRIAGYLKCAHFNADKVRALAEDWRFDKKARVRQANRMKHMADFEHSREGGFKTVTVTDFVCPTETTRILFQPGLTIWMNTLDARGEESPYADTNSMWEDPLNAEIIIESFMTDTEILNLTKRIVRDWSVQIAHDL